MPEPTASLSHLSSLPRLNLALQGGGSHGALTWGVLDALLEDGQWQFDGVSGTSAGAMNAVAMAHGFAKAAQEHKDPHEAHLAGCAQARETLTRLWEGVGTLGSLMWGSPLSAANPMMGLMRQWLSPYQTNPLDINPLRRLLEREVDFDLLCTVRRASAAAGGPKVFVCATNVRTGRGEIFSGPRLSADAVMASACLPALFKAVEIDGEHYWDGGYSGNPALYPLIYQTSGLDILLVRLTPLQRTDNPTRSIDIIDRLSEITFNASLISEMRAIAFVKRLIDEQKLDRGRYKPLHMHMVADDAGMSAFNASSKFNTDWAFLQELHRLGHQARLQRMRELISRDA